MRFMILRKADKKTEAGVLPDERLLAAFERYNAEGVKAGVLLAGEGLQPSSKRARVKFSGGRPVVTDGPFTEAKELVAGFGMIEVKSKEEAIEWVKHWPVLDGDGEVEIEIREVGCPGGLVGVSPSGSAGTSNRDGASSMRFMILLKADEEAEADFIPEAGLLAAMAKRNEEAMRAGVMLAGEGLKSSSKGARVKFAGGRPMVTDGPFAEVKELIAGFWVIRVGSKEEAIEWVRNYPYPRRAEAEVEIRQVFEASDFAPVQ